MVDRRDIPQMSWMKPVLLAAAGYNLLWGGLVVLLPQWTLGLIGLPDATPHLWQCIGMIVGVYGVGYAIAAFNPLRHWPIVLVGLLGKILGPIGFVQGVITDSLPLQMGWTILTNDLIWWLPFGLILHHAWRRHRGGNHATITSEPGWISAQR
jgi:hypothetical protein